ncbi:beta-galactosidase 9-like [Hibiscus syriacus]|uniref:Beta-galactosidase 9-like n=1 Tax=Hibiscus syriacus TaxID=106335 RepID=A0A6A2X181_HIBSY|nr:beta-galactosidase 9-like [Hibiscus syriacus]
MLKTILKHQNPCRVIGSRFKTSSVQYVESRARDATFEKLMDKYKNLLKVIAIQDLILAIPPITLLRSPLISSPSSPKSYISTVAPPLFSEAEAINASLPSVVDRLVRLLSMSTTKSLPLRAVFKVWRELGLPDDFEDSIISRNPHIFTLFDAHEPNTHILTLADEMRDERFVTSVKNWRVTECWMRLRRDFKAKVKEWQRLPYVGPYEEMGEKKRSKAGVMEVEKRVVAVVHEFLSLTVERMVEVEKISHFRKSFAIDLNIRDLFLDHPGMFYLSTKGKRHTVFLREAYERGCLIDSNPVYSARRKLLDLVVLGRHAMLTNESRSVETNQTENPCLKDENGG